MSETPLTVVVWGDSIAAGSAELQWPALAERTCNLVLNTGQTVRVVNEGVGGKPASHARHEFEERVLAHKPALVFIQFGFNDLRYDGSRGDKPLSTPAEFEEHLRDMVRSCRELAGAKVVLFGNHRTQLNLTMPGGKSYDEMRVEYDVVVRRVAANLQVPYYDLSEELKVPGASWTELLADDGVHLSPLGYHAYGRFAAGVIRGELFGG